MDNDLFNEDWLRTMRWDLWAGDKLVTTLNEFLNVLGVSGRSDDEKRRAVEAATKMPFYVPAPDELKTEVDAFLSAKVKKSLLPFSPTITLK